MNSPAMRFYIFESFGLVFFVMALVLRALGHDVSFLKRPARMQSRFWEGMFAVFGIHPVDFQTCKKLEAGSLSVDSYNLGGEILVELAARKNIGELCAGLFPPLKNDGEKIKAMLLRRIQWDIQPVQMMAAWRADYILQHPGVEVCLVARRSLPRRILLEKISDLSILIPAWLFFSGTFFSGIFRALGALFRRKQGMPACSGKFVAVNPAIYPVIFFPHMGVSYGNLFEKNQFYSDDRNSPFHRENILHVDIHDGVQWDEGGEPGISIPRLTVKRALSVMLRNLPFYLRHFWRVRKSFFSSPIQYSVSIAGMIFLEHLRFSHYLHHCRQFASARIALVGYEILFPQPLSLALECLGILTVASQERFIATFIESHGFILDTYFVPTPHVGELLQKNKISSFKQYIPVGQVRSDVLYSFEQELKMLAGLDARNPRPMVLVLDFHSAENREDNRLFPLNNYSANRHFYLQIARLAVEFPDCDFVVRGKADDWLSIPVFEDIAGFFDILPNITVSRDYSRFNVQYELAAQAAVVIARYTSMGEECLGAGKPVIFVDYYPNCVPYVEKIFDYENLPVLAHDYETLKKRLSDWLENPAAFDTPELRRFRKKYYGPHDGKVRDRIAEALNEIYASCCEGRFEKSEGAVDDI